jgi:heme-degrading monooxygenase HmoA
MEVMPYLLERHKVQDYGRWREVFDADAGSREAAGCRGARIFRDADDPEEVVVLFEWDALERVRDRIESATLSRKFEEAGGQRGDRANRVPPPRSGTRGANLNAIGSKDQAQPLRGLFGPYSPECMEGGFPEVRIHHPA